MTLAVGEQEGTGHGAWREEGPCGGCGGGWGHQTKVEFGLSCKCMKSYCFNLMSMSLIRMNVTPAGKCGVRTYFRCGRGSKARWQKQRLRRRCQQQSRFHLGLLLPPSQGVASDHYP